MTFLPNRKLSPTFESILDVVILHSNESGSDQRIIRPVLKIIKQT